MIPKISVSPEATRNSSRPYCTLLRHWMRKVVRSMGQSRQPRAGSARPLAAMPTFLFTLPLTSRR